MIKLDDKQIKTLDYFLCELCNTKTPEQELIIEDSIRMCLACYTKQIENIFED